VLTVAISSDGNYFTVGGKDNQVYLFRWTPSAVIDEDDDDLDIDYGEEAIPFGNYYILFMIIGILSLIIIKKNKFLFSK